MYDLAIMVPARRGSSRVANKSMLPFGDADSLIEWKLRQLARIIDPARIYLSSEDDEFLAIATRLGATPIKREAWLATGHAATLSDLVTGIMGDIPHEHIAWCTVVCPLMAPQEYLDCFRAYHDKVIHGDHDSLLGVNLAKEYYWSDSGSLNYEATPENHCYTQALPDWYRVTNSIYMYNRAQMLAERYFLGRKPVLQPLSKLAGVDIDHMIDYRIARALYPVYLEEGLDQIDPATRIDWARRSEMRAA